MTRLGTTCCLNSCGHGVVSPSTTVGYINYVGIYGFNVDSKNGRHCVSWVIDSDCPPGITKHRRSHAREQNFSSLSRNTLPFGAVERIHLCLVVSAFFSSGLGTRTMATCSVMSTPIVAATPAVAGMT